MTSFFYFVYFLFTVVANTVIFSCSSSYLTADGFVVGAVLFCHLILRGRASENDTAEDWREESHTNTCLKVFGQILPYGSLLQLPLLFGLQRATAVSREVGEEQTEKHSGIQHSVFLAS